MIASQSSSVVSSRPLECGPATIAFGTITSSRPVRSTAVRTSRSMSAALEASDGTNVPGRRLEDQLDRRPAALARLRAHVADDDVGALGGEAQRHRAPEARRAAGHDDRFPRQPSHGADRRRGGIGVTARQASRAAQRSLISAQVGAGPGSGSAPLCVHRLEDQREVAVPELVRALVVAGAHAASCSKIRDRSCTSRPGRSAPALRVRSNSSLEQLGRRAARSPTSPASA